MIHFANGLCYLSLILWKLLLFWNCFKYSNQVIIMHMPRQSSCRDMWKIETVGNHCFSSKINNYFLKIWITSLYTIGEIALGINFTADSSNTIHKWSLLYFFMAWRLRCSVLGKYLLCFYDQALNTTKRNCFRIWIVGIIFKWVPRLAPCQ